MEEVECVEKVERKKMPVKVRGMPVDARVDSILQVVEPIEFNRRTKRTVLALASYAFGWETQRHGDRKRRALSNLPDKILAALGVTQVSPRWVRGTTFQVVELACNSACRRLGSINLDANEIFQDCCRMIYQCKFSHINSFNLTNRRTSAPIPNRR